MSHTEIPVVLHHRDFNVHLFKFLLTMSHYSTVTSFVSQAPW